MFLDNQIVLLKRDMPAENLRVGMTGTIVMVYPKEMYPDLPQSYEVEFSDNDGITIALLTLLESDIVPAKAPHK